MKGILLSLCLLTGVVSAQNLSAGLVICMPMNGNVSDYSGNANNGTPYNLTSAPDRFGNPNSAMLFNGSGSKIVVPASASINNIETVNEITIAAWCKIDSFGHTNCFPVANKYNPSTNWGWDYTIQPPATHNGQIFVPNATQMSNYTICKGNEGVILNQWDFYAITFSTSSQQFRVYRNDTLLTTVNTGSCTLENTGNNDLYIGCSPAITLDFAHGYIDDYYIWSRALSPAEIHAVYSGSLSCLGDSPSDIGGQGIRVGQISLFPNPAGSKLNFSFPADAGVISMRVYDVLGHEVIARQGETCHAGIAEMDITNLSEGVYFAFVQTAVGSRTLKFVKSNP